METNKFLELKELVNSLEADYNKFYENKNKTAGTRVRQGMQSIKSIAQDIRTGISETKRNLV